MAGLSQIDFSQVPTLMSVAIASASDVLLGESNCLSLTRQLIASFNGKG